MTYPVKFYLYLWLIPVIYLLSFMTQAKTIQVKLNGSAVYKKFNSDYFLAALYLSKNSDKPQEILQKQEIKRMEFRILRDNLSSRQFTLMLREFIAINNSKPFQKKMSDKIVTFAKFLELGQLQRGDKICLDYFPQVGTRVTFNDRLIGTIQGEEFYPMMLRTWIGSRPPSEKFKRSILGLETQKTSKTSP